MSINSCWFGHGLECRGWREAAFSSSNWFLLFFVSSLIPEQQLEPERSFSSSAPAMRPGGKKKAVPQKPYKPMMFAPSFSPARQLILEKSFLHSFDAAVIRHALQQI